MENLILLKIIIPRRSFEVSRMEYNWRMNLKTLRSKAQKEDPSFRGSKTKVEDKYSSSN